MYELDTLIKRMMKDRLTELNTTMQCTVMSVSPLKIKPIPVKKYVTGTTEYPEIISAKILKQWVLVGGANFEEVPVAYDIPLNIGDKVIVAFGKDDLSDAVILGVI